MRKWETFSEEELREIYQQSSSKTDFIEKLGYQRGSHVSENFNQIKSRYSWVKDFQRTAWNKEDLTGKIYGKLKVISNTGKNQNGHSVWLCQCKCGNFTEVAANHLKSGNTQSCGCMHKEFITNLGRRMVDDLKGKTFNYLQVLYDSGERQNGNIKWVCRCLNCGKITQPIAASSIKRGITKSCGCLQESFYEKMIENILKELNIAFEKQFVFPDLKGDFDNLRFDFALFKDENLICLIEYQGEQHYNPVEFFGGDKQFKKTLKYDSLKEEYCKNNDIKLIKIPYWENVNKEYIIDCLKKECCECLQMV